MQVSRGVQDLCLKILQPTNLKGDLNTQWGKKKEKSHKGKNSVGHKKQRSCFASLPCTVQAFFYYCQYLDARTRIPAALSPPE